MYIQSRFWQTLYLASTLPSNQKSEVCSGIDLAYTGYTRISWVAASTEPAVVARDGQSRSMFEKGGGRSTRRSSR